MILTLRILFTIILLSMLAVTFWASSQVALWKLPHQIATHPWFIASLFDAYFGFITFYCWLFYKETKPATRILWFIAILLLGNIAMATYILRLTFALPLNASPADLLLRRNP